MARKIPADAAFAHYVELGLKRSYRAVAERFKCSKRSITALAKRDGWQARLEALEQRAREGVERKAVETIEEMSDRHLRILQLLQRRALQVLKTTERADPSQALRTLVTSLREERVLRNLPVGSSADDQAHDMAEKIRSFLQAAQETVRVSGPDGTPQSGTNGAEPETS